MNNIDDKITETDRQEAKRKRKSTFTYAHEIIDHLKFACLYSTTFLHSIPVEKRAEVEAGLKKSFENWANSHIAPLCREMIAKSQ